MYYIPTSTRNGSVEMVTAQGRNENRGAKKKMRCLDLFTGMGGFALALRHLCHTSAYCDFDPVSRELLAQRMASQQLDRAPVLPDVTRVSPDELRALAPDIITAGFPCQDISCMKMSGAEGIYGERSGLFFEIPAMVRACPSIRHVLLENSPCLQTRGRGFERVLHELHACGLTHVAYGTFAAAQVGAPHCRKRWFCLASREPTELPLMTPEQLRDALAHRWRADHGAAYLGRAAGGGDGRLIPMPPRGGAERAALWERYHLMGNAVVPQVVAFAYQTLATTLRECAAAPGPSPREKRSITSKSPWVVAVAIAPPGKGHTTTDLEYARWRNRPLPAAATQRAEARLRDCTTYHERPPLAVRPQLPQYAVLTAVDDHGKKVSLGRLWPTPRRSMWAQCRTMTDRCLADMPTAMYFESDTRCEASPSRALRSDHCAIDPRYVEQMMGFPDNWSRLAPPPREKNGRTRAPPPHSNTGSGGRAASSPPRPRTR